MTESTPRPWIPNTCIITGRLVGHPDTCGDCDPCIAGGSMPAPVKALLDEMVHWCARFEDAECRNDEALALLREAQQLVAEREYLEQHEFYYAQGSPEPSPAEWGVSACYQQTAEAGPKDQFGFDVRDYHVGNKHEHDEDSGGTMTLANRIDVFLEKEKGNG